jgi:hypothetical protein
MIERVVSYFMGEGMSEQPQVARLLLSQPGEFLTDKNPVLAKTEAENVFARELSQVKLI